MPKTIEELRADVQRFKAMKQGGAMPIEAPATTTPAPVARPTTTSTGRNFADIDAALKKRAAGNIGAAPEPPAPSEPGIGEKIVKGLFSAPATIVARPLQAAAVATGDVVGQDIRPEVEAFSQKASGGLVAPMPQNFKDVQKDVGRAAETVALGTGAPIAGGALFGAGASLEAGNDLLSAQTAVDAALGAAGGKVAEWVGKPLLDATGKVVGAITPTIIKDVASRGADAVQEFARANKLLGGIAEKPAAAFASGMQNVDDAIVNTIKQGGSNLQKVAAEQFPAFNPVKHYTDVAERDLIKPTTLNESKFAKATAIYNEAKAKGIDLEKHATASRIFHDDLIGDGKFNTAEAADALRESVYKDGSEIIRPALKEIEPNVRTIPISEVRESILSRIDSIPASKASAEVKAQMKRVIKKRYSDTGAEAKAHPNGFTLTDLHDARIERGRNGKYVLGVTSETDVVKARLARREERAFADLFDNTVPADAGFADIRKEFQKNFLLADYLKALNGKKVPEGAAKKAIRLFGRATAATVGGKIGGFPGAILGSQYGDMLFASFEALPNPVKRAVLSRLMAEKSPAFDVLRQYLGDLKAEKLMQKALPAAGQSSYKGQTLFATPGGVTTPDKGEAIDITAVEQGRAKAPKDGRAPATRKRLREYVQENNQGPYVAPDEMQVIPLGKKPRTPRSINDIVF